MVPNVENDDYCREANEKTKDLLPWLSWVTSRHQDGAVKCELLPTQPCVGKQIQDNVTRSSGQGRHYYVMNLIKGVHTDFTTKLKRMVQYYIRNNKYMNVNEWIKEHSSAFSRNCKFWVHFKCIKCSFHGTRD